MVAITHPAPAVIRLRPTARRTPRPRVATPAVYRRRRLAALGLLVVAVALLAALAGTLLRDATGSLPSEPVATVSVVVAPGDTVWSLAASIAPGDDPRPIVDAIVEANGGAALVAGQRLTLTVP